MEGFILSITVLAAHLEAVALNHSPKFFQKSIVAINSAHLVQLLSVQLQFIFFWGAWQMEMEILAP